MFLNEAKNYVIKEVGNVPLLHVDYKTRLHMLSSDCLHFIYEHSLSKQDPLKHQLCEMRRVKGMFWPLISNTPQH